MQFKALAALPGWEATDGNFRLCACGRLRFLRYARKAGDKLAFAVVTDTPRGFDLLIEATAARYAEAAAGAAA